MSNKSKGTSAERELINKVLPAEGYTQIIRAAASLGLADIVAWGPNRPLTVIEAKYIGEQGRAGFSKRKVLADLLTIPDPSGGRLLRQLRIKRFRMGWEIIEP